MATNETKIVQNLNNRARFFGGEDAPQLTMYHVRAALDFYHRKCQDPHCPTPDKLAYSMDHYRPLSDGGANELENIIVLHTNCNKRKGDKIVNWKISAFCPNDYVNRFLPKRLIAENSQGNSTLNNGNPRAKGGAREGAGRKPGAYTQLKRRLEAEKIEDAEYGIALYVDVMRNEDEELPIRLTAADWVVKQVIGNPKNRDQVNGEVLVRIIRDGKRN